mgnify:FL=1|jgi:hypothetical protein
MKEIMEKHTVSLEGLQHTLENDANYVLAKYVIDKSLNPQIDLMDYFEAHGFDDLVTLVWKAEHNTHIETIVESTTNFLNGRTLKGWTEKHGVILMETI